MPAEDIRATAREYATERYAAIFYTLGITEHACAVDNIWSLSNLVLATGHLGYESTGLNALRGQNNVQGLNDSGANPAYYPGYQSADDPEVRAKFAAAWGVDVPETLGYRLDQIISGLHDGRTKALYLVGENPAHTEPNAKHVEEGFEHRRVRRRAGSVPERAHGAHADVVFPASSFAEKDGTFTNTERRVNRVRAGVPLSRARRGSTATSSSGSRGRWARRGPSTRTPSRSGTSSPTCRRTGTASATTGSRSKGIQWPCLDRDDPGSKILHAPRPSRPNGKGKLWPVEYQPPIELPDTEYPLTLSTGPHALPLQLGHDDDARGGITDKQEDPFFEISAEDASALGLADGDWARLVSRRGDLEARAQHHRPRLPGSRLDGAPLRAGEGELADARRRRPADRHAGVQGQRRPGRADLSLAGAESGAAPLRFPQTP